MKPWKQAGLNTIGYIAAFVLVQILSKHSLGWDTALILAAVYFVLSYVFLSAIRYADKKKK